jgi:hypothetical protein
MPNSLTTKQILDLNRMNAAANHVSLGTMLTTTPTAGSYVVLQSEASASAVSVYTGVASLKGNIVQVVRTGSPVKDIGASVVMTTGSLVITGSAASCVKTSDVINYVVW